MSTPPTPVPPPRREGRRFAIPTPADLRHPGARRRPSAPEDERDGTPDTPDEGIAQAQTTQSLAPGTAEPATAQPPMQGQGREPDAHSTTEGISAPPVTAGAAVPTTASRADPGAAPTPVSPRTAGPTPGTMPRRGRPRVDAVETSRQVAPQAEDGGPSAAVGAEAPTGNAVESPARDQDSESAEGPRRLFPNPATLMAAGRGVRKVRPGGLRGRRLPKVEETSAGGVVLDLSSDPPAVALIARHDRRSRLLWSLPKGHVEEGETPEQAALREVFEETGLVGRIVAPLGVIDFWFVVEDKRIHKTVHHYVIEAVGGELSDEDVEVEAVEWIPFHQVVRKLAYGDERRLVEKVPQIVPGVK